jgi:glycosyltransferase involved in cell wall biosynthesis
MMSQVEVLAMDARLTAGDDVAARASSLDDSSKLRILWVFTPDYRYGMEHGANLRIFSHTRELISRGHEMYFAVSKHKTDDPAEKRKYFEALRAQKIITDYFEIEYKYPKLRGKLAQVLLHPMLANRLLREAQSPVTIAIQQAIADRQINVCIFVDRNPLFVLPEIKGGVTTVVDWIDSLVLYRLRDIKLHLRKRQLKQIPSALRHLLNAFVEESYYGKHSAANVAVSPVDKKYIDFLNRRPQKNTVLLNGVNRQETRARTEKIKNRIIFTGNMDFPPNYESAIWFIDNVLPRLLERRPELKLVIAGGNPVEKLLSKAGAHVEVTGYVQDMKEEIGKSELYVAPLVCGGGFKNKVVEAITSRTFVVATSIAVEFLSPEVREQLLVADTPQQMVDAILYYFENPQKFEDRLEPLKKVIDEEFTWENRTKELLEIIHEAAAAQERRDRSEHLASSL